MGQVRDAKKQETRQRISDIATGLFFKYGFEAVTVEEIAVAAHVSKMTVFNYFARKEELFLDREEDLRLVPFREALKKKPVDQTPVDALRAFVREMSKLEHPLFYIDDMLVRWWRVLAASPSLTARLRELTDEAADGLAIELGGDRPAGAVRLAAGMIALAVRTAREESVRMIEDGATTKKVNAAFLALIEQALSAVERILP